jgi:hypothetical protein
MWIIARNVAYSIGGRCEERDTESEEVSRSLRTSSRDRDGETLGNTSSGGRGELRDRGGEEGNGSGEATQSSSTSSIRTDERGHDETLAYSKCLGWEQRTTEQEEFDRERSPDQLDFSGEGFGRSRTSSHVADTSSEGLQGRNIDPTIRKGREKESQLGNESGGAREDVANTNRQRGRGGSTRREDAEDAWKSSRIREDEGIWFTEPNVGRVAHGVSKRVDRLKGLGNAIVPELAMQIGLAIKEEIKKGEI